METTNIFLQTNKLQDTTERRSASSRLLSCRRFYPMLLLAILAGVALLTIGPAVLQTIEQTSSQMSHLLLQGCRLSLVVLEILGK